MLARRGGLRIYDDPAGRIEKSISHYVILATRGMHRLLRPIPQADNVSTGRGGFCWPKLLPTAGRVDILMRNAVVNVYVGSATGLTEAVLRKVMRAAAS